MLEKKFSKYFSLLLCFYSPLQSFAAHTIKNRNLCQGAPGQFVYNKDPKTNSYVKGGFVAHTAKVRGSRAFLGQWKGHYLTKKIFIGPDAQICDFAQVKQHARVTGHAIVRSHAIVQGEALVSEKATIEGETLIQDKAVITGTASIHKNAAISGSAIIRGAASVLSHAIVTGHAIVEGKSIISDFVKITGYAHIKDHAQIYGHTEISGNSIIQGKTFFAGHTKIHDTSVKDHSRILGPKTDEPPLTLHGPLTVQGYSCLQNSILLNHGVWDSQRVFHKAGRFYQTRAIQDSEHIISDDCSICLDNLSSKKDTSSGLVQGCVQTTCGHQFHQDCFSDCLRQSLTCPLCRESLFSETLTHPIETSK
ncbi:MAG: RING finger domain-containing protein [Oligoflexales bacterium]